MSSSRTLESNEALARGTSDEVEIKAGVVLADDVGGGWTNRYTTEASVRFAPAALKAARRIIEGLGAEPAHPQTFAGMYGDAA